MQLTACFVATILAFATTCSANPTPRNLRTRCQDHDNSTGTNTGSGNATSQSTLPGLPSDCMVSQAGIAWGWIPDDASGSDVTISSLNSATGKKSCFFGDYSKINDASYDGSDITYKGANAEGSIMVPSVMPVGVTWSEVTTSLASQIGTVVKSFTDQGITTYLRFAHEMNCYAKPGCASPEYPGEEDYEGFKQAWINVANACKGIDGCYMMWSPNLQDVSSLNNWWPGSSYVDIIAVDHYPSSDDDVNGGFSGAYDEFYSQIVEPNGKPFLLYVYSHPIQCCIRLPFFKERLSVPYEVC